MAQGSGFSDQDFGMTQTMSVYDGIGLPAGSTDFGKV